MHKWAKSAIILLNSMGTGSGGRGIRSEETKTSTKLIDLARSGAQKIRGLFRAAVGR